MIAHFARLFVGALTKFGLASLICYTAVIYTLEAELDLMTDGCRYCPGTRSYHYLQLFHLKEPWPANYLSYLFEPGGIPTVYGGEVDRYFLDLEIFGFRVQGAGVLTGDFGSYWWGDKSGAGKPILEDLDHSLDLIFIILLALILTFAYVAVVQRTGSPTPYKAYESRLPALADSRYLQPANYRLGV